jgi:hypothetical protein
MAPMDSSPARLPMLTLHVPLHILRDPGVPYVDNY